MQDKKKRLLVCETTFLSKKSSRRQENRLADKKIACRQLFSPRGGSGQETNKRASLLVDQFFLAALGLPEWKDIVSSLDDWVGQMVRNAFVDTVEAVRAARVEQHASWVPLCTSVRVASACAAIAFAPVLRLCWEIVLVAIVLNFLVPL